MKKQYRWDRRRGRQKTPRQQFDVSDLILLILVFALGLVAFHILRGMAFQSASCTEQIANFGNAFGAVPAFKTMFYLSIVLLAYWGVLFATRLRQFKTAARYILQAFLFTCILCTGFLSFHMSIWDRPNPPDGTLAVTQGIWSYQNGHIVWRPYPFDTVEIDGDIVSAPAYPVRNCVWLNTGMISADSDIFVDNYDEYIANLQRRNEDGTSTIYHFSRWKPPSLLGYFRAIISTKSHLQIVRDQERLRPLLDVERQRFMDKQRYIENTYTSRTPPVSRPHAKTIEHCDPMLWPNW